MNFNKYGIILLSLILFTSSLHAEMIVIINRPQSDKDSRGEYARELLYKIMDITEKEYGPYTIQYSRQNMVWERMMTETKRGALINVVSAATRPHWEKELIPIRIPLIKGILGYRIFLIHKDNENKLHNINTLDELKKLYAGLGIRWSITKTFEDNGFNINTDLEYENLFKLLAKKRFDYFPRGINEIFDEFVLRKELYPDLIIEKTIALYLPLPVYYFVSPQNPEIAERIEKGLNQMIADGSFDKHFYKHYQSIIKQSKLNKRKIFRIENNTLTPETPMDNKKLWWSIKN